MTIQRVHGQAVGRSKTVVANGMVWTVATANVDKTSVASQTRECLQTIESNLLEVGSSKSRIVEALVCLTDMTRKAEMDAEWCAWIPDDAWPCRACVGTDLAPGDLVEIKVTALQ